MDDRRGLVGFTLVELVVTVAIVAVVSLIAIPSYLSYVQKGRRTDAISSLLHVQLRQAEWRINHDEYATLDELAWKIAKRNSLDGFYTIEMIELDADRYRTIAIPVGDQGRDTCGVFAVDQTGMLYSGYAGPECWSR